MIFIIISIIGNSCNTAYSGHSSITETALLENPALPGSDGSELIFPDLTNNKCLSCHKGIEPIRDPASGMMQEIYKMAGQIGYKDNGCIVCHGGNPDAPGKVKAHSGSVEQLIASQGAVEFYPDPASVWINDKTCGLCHQEQVTTQFTSLMFTEAGKIQGTTWSFGGINGYNHNVANVATGEVDAHQRLGSEVYKKYMAELKQAEPQVFPGTMEALPRAPTPEELDKNPALAVYTYLRAECQRCHIGVKGHRADGDYRGRRIGVSYEGLMESSYTSPFMSNGDNQKQIHKKNYIHVQMEKKEALKGHAA